MPDVIKLDVLEEYKDNVKSLCQYLSRMQWYADKQKRGEKFKRALFVYCCERVITCKTNVLALKKQLGFTDELTFLEDNNFIGFSIKDGHLNLDDGITNSDVFKIVDKWFFGFPATANHYQFEVANFVVALAEVETTEEENDFPESVWEYVHRKRATN